MRLFFEIISGKKKGPLFSFVRALLFLFSLLFSALVFIRKKLYHLRLKKSSRVQSITVSIGNLTTGGTGKTPFTIFLAEKLSQKMQTAILLRGYKSHAENAVEPVVLHPGQKCNFQEVGDEASLICRNSPHTYVYVNKNRIKSAKLAESQGAKCLLLDDGMQHLAIQRDFEVVILDAKNPFGYGYLLPRGLLREPISSLERADLIVLNRVDRLQDTFPLEEVIQSYSRAPIIKTTVVFEGIFDADGKKQAFSQAQVALFCGIGNPTAFYELVQRNGFEVVEALYLQDHEPLDAQRLVDFSCHMQKCGAKALLCTEKDMVKVARQDRERLTLPLYYVGVQLKIVAGERLFEKFTTDILLNAMSIPKWFEESGI